MMKNQSVVIGGGALIFGLILGIAVSGARVDDKIAQAMSRVDDATTAAASAQQEAIAAVEERMGALETELSDVAGTAAELSEGIGAQMTDIQQGLAAQIEAVMQRAEAEVAALRDALASATPKGSDEAVEKAVDSATLAPRSVGETAVIADGALRVFVSRIDMDAGTARLSINGSNTTLAVGEASTVSLESGDCAVSIAALGADGVSLASDCGGVTAVADVPAAPTEGFRPGEVAKLADGSLSVFVSGLAADNSAARLAINGLALETVASGSTVEVASDDKSCTLTVTGVGDGLVGLEGTCG